MAVALLRQLFLLLKALLLCSKRLLKDTWGSLLGKLTFLFTILRSRLRIGTTRRVPGVGRDPTSFPLLPIPPSNDISHALDKPIHDTATTTTLTTTKDTTIPLDSKIACSLSPYPYLHRNMSRTTLNHASGLSAARSAHSAAVSSRQASRSSHQLYLSDTSRKGSMDGLGYTISVQSPTSPMAHRQYSLSSPQLGSGSATGGAENSGYFGDGIIQRTNSSSPTDSLYDSQDHKHPSVHEPAYPPSPIGSTRASLGGVEKPNLEHDRIFPIAPEFFQRYTKNHYAERKKTEFKIKALTLDFREHKDPPGWTSIIHPEGILYFYNHDKKTVTESNLYDDRYYEQITDDIGIIEEFLCVNEITLPEDHTLAMELNMQSDGVFYTDYYFVDHKERTIFFLDDLDAHINFPVWHEVRGITSISHIRHELEAQYWHHGMFYPTTIAVTAERVGDLRDILLHYIGDLSTSPFSTSPYSLPELNTMLSQVNSIEKNIGARFAGASSLLCRMNHIFSRQKFINWHGLPEARIHRDQSVYGKRKKRRTLLIRILSPLLFSAPDTHLANLERMWVDEIMHGAVWLQSINKLNEEWQEFTLYATVLLNANVAFLAIQSIDIDRNPYRSPVQVSSYLSIVASIGSIILGLLLTRQNRTRAHGTIDDVCAFLKARSHPTLGLETLAILYSLPYALLLWGMVSFLAAFAWNCFDNSNIGTRTVMGVAWVAFGVLVLWCMWMGWVKHEDVDASENVAASPEEAPETKEERDNSTGRSGGTGRVVTLIKNLKVWTWPARLLVRARRPSLDSQRTAIHPLPATDV